MNIRKFAKKNKILFSFILIGLISLSFIIMGFGLQWFSPYEESVNIEDKTIRYDWLNVQLYNDPADNVEFSKGGLKLTEFENEGIFQQNDETNEIVYKSRATFLFELNMYTDVDIFDVWPEINTNKEVSYRFLDHRRYQIWPFGAYWNTYDVKWREVDLGNTFNAHDYDFMEEISIGITPDFADLSGEVINGIEISSTEYIYQVKTVEVVDIRDGTCGDYEDQYTDQEVETGIVDFEQFLEDSVTNTQALSKIASFNLGYIPGEATDDITVQNYKIDTFPVGYTEINPTSNEPMIFEERVVLRPEITKSVQEFEIRYGFFESCDFYGTSTVFDVHAEDVSRIRSVHVYNQFIHKEYKVNVNFLSTVELSAEEYTSYLSDPYLKQGDWLWNEEIGGTTEVAIVSNESALTQLWESFMNTFFGIGGILTWIIVIIVIAVALVIFIKIGIPLIQSRIRRKEYEQIKQ